MKDNKSYNYKWLRGRLKIKEVRSLPTSETWLKIKEAAEVLGISEQTVRLKYLRGVIPVLKIKGNSVLYVRI